MKKIAFAGMITAVSFVSMSIGAVAASNLEEIQAYLNKGVSITLHGEKWTPKDSDGSTLYPITYNGSTYLPVRAVAEAAGLPVEWKGDTQTVALGESKTEVVSLSENEMVMKYIDVYINGTDLSAKQQFVKDYIHSESQQLFGFGAMGQSDDRRSGSKIIQSIKHINEKNGKMGRMVLVQSDNAIEDIFYFVDNKIAFVYTNSDKEIFPEIRNIFN